MTGLLPGSRIARVFEYICCDERDDDTILPSCGDYIGFRDKTISHDSTKAAAIFKGNGGIYTGTCIHTYIHTYMHACILGYSYIYRYIYAYMFIYTYTYAPIHTYSCIRVMDLQ